MARIRTTHGFLSLLILLILSSLCFLLLVDLHTRFMIQTPPSLDYVSSDQSDSSLTFINRENLASASSSSNLLQFTQYELQKRLNNGSLLPAEYKIALAYKFWSTIKSIPWFMKGGNFRPLSSLSNIYSSLPIFPHEDPSSDRIANQLMYIPANYEQIIAENHPKKIYLADAFFSWSSSEIVLGQERFLRDKCPVNTCTITIDPNEVNMADAVIFKVNNYVNVNLA